MEGCTKTCKSIKIHLCMYWYNGYSIHTYVHVRTYTWKFIKIYTCTVITCTYVQYGYNIHTVVTMVTTYILWLPWLQHTCCLVTMVTTDILWLPWLQQSYCGYHGYNRHTVVTTVTTYILFGYHAVFFSHVSFSTS